MIGTILRQRYRIIKQLGKGGFGETYLAEDLDIPVTPKPVCVVKKLHPEEIDQYTIRLFEQEAKTLYKLGQNHNQIPKLYAYFQEGQDFYLVQEFIDGHDLTQEISPGKKLSENDVIQLLRDVLEILVYVHENKVIHRDIKPANIMRRKDGKLVLIDFGIVKQINNTITMKSGSTKRTKPLIGTLGYMPTEQAIGKPKYSSDIYALGIMVIQALIDLYPWNLPKDDDGEIIWNDKIEISGNLEKIITKMVSDDWTQRYRNAKEALDELNQIFVINQRLLLAVTKLVAVRLNGKYGYVSGGKLVIPCQFGFANDFSEGLASVRKGAKWGFINTIGKLVIPCQFDDAWLFSEGLAKVQIEEKLGFINTIGKLVIPCQFDNADNFSEELAMVQIGEKYGYINTNGQMVIPCEFNQIYWFSEGLAAVKVGEKYGYINTNGQIVISCQFDRTVMFSEGLATVRIGDKCGYINTNGQIVIPCQFDHASGFSEGLAKVTISGKDYLIDKTGKIIY